MSTRVGVTASWQAAKRFAGCSHSVILNSASCAGMLLTLAQGDPHIALSRLAQVRDYLERVAREEDGIAEMTTNHETKEAAQ